jgi:hypothetical protein
VSEIPQVLYVTFEDGMLVGTFIDPAVAERLNADRRRVKHVEPVTVRYVAASVIRQAVADYMRSEGCRCCQNIEAHEKHAVTLGALLDVPKYEDDSGYNFAQFSTQGSAP